VTKKQLKEIPVIFMAYDLLENKGVDIRSLPMKKRRSQLEKTLSKTKVEDPIRLSPLITFSNWNSLEEIKMNSRRHVCKGIMLKRFDSTYQEGRNKGAWWKWKVDPLRIEAILLYAQKGKSGRAKLFTDFTFAVWNEGNLVPVARANSGLGDEELGDISHFVSAHTIERFGPVYSVKPELVFELAFEDIWVSKRHKSGIALSMTRIISWRKDKVKEEANSLKDLHALLIKH